MENKKITPRYDMQKAKHLEASPNLQEPTENHQRQNDSAILQEITQSPPHPRPNDSEIRPRPNDSDSDAASRNPQEAIKNHPQQDSDITRPLRQPSLLLDSERSQHPFAASLNPPPHQRQNTTDHATHYVGRHNCLEPPQTSQHYYDWMKPIQHTYHFNSAPIYFIQDGSKLNEIREERSKKNSVIRYII